MYLFHCCLPTVTQFSFDLRPLLQQEVADNFIHPELNPVYARFCKAVKGDERLLEVVNSLNWFSKIDLIESVAERILWAEKENHFYKNEFIEKHQIPNDGPAAIFFKSRNIVRLKRQGTEVIEVLQFPTPTETDKSKLQLLFTVKAPRTKDKFEEMVGLVKAMNNSNKKHYTLEAIKAAVSSC